MTLAAAVTAQSIDSIDHSPAPILRNPSQEFAGQLVRERSHAEREEMLPGMEHGKTEQSPIVSTAARYSSSVSQDRISTIVFRASQRSWLEQEDVDPVNPRSWLEQEDAEPVNRRLCFEMEDVGPIKPRSWLEHEVAVSDCASQANRGGDHDSSGAMVSVWNAELGAERRTVADDKQASVSHNIGQAVGRKSRPSYKRHWNGFIRKKNSKQRGASPRLPHDRCSSPRQTHLSHDVLQTRLHALEKLDAYIVQHPRYQCAVMRVINAMLEDDLTLNHVNCFGAVEELSEHGRLCSPVLQCLRGGDLVAVDKNDINQGFGYYHFNRISAGTMSNSPSFCLNSQENSIMFFIDPRVFSRHHFVAGQNNPHRQSAERCPGKLHSMMTKEDALEEALRAVKKLSELIQQGATRVPVDTEIAIFKGIESSFVYPHVAVLEGCVVSQNPWLQKRLLTVTPKSKRYEMGKKAITSSLLM